MACLLGICTNILTMIVISNASTREFKKDFSTAMYKHLMANCLFNIIYCLIKLVSLVNVCIFPATSFCSGVLTTVSSQYVKIYLINFLGSICKLSLNSSYVFFALSRFYVSTSSPSKFFKWFSNLNTVRFYVLIVSIGVLLSLFELFKVSLKKVKTYHKCTVNSCWNLHAIYFRD